MEPIMAESVTVGAGVAGRMAWPNAAAKSASPEPVVAGAGAGGGGAVVCSLGAIAFTGTGDSS